MFSHYNDVRQDEVVLYMRRPSIRQKQTNFGYRLSSSRARPLQQKVPPRAFSNKERDKDKRIKELRSGSQPCVYEEVSLQAIRPVFREFVHGYEGQLYLGSTVPYGRQLQALSMEHEEVGKVHERPISPIARHKTNSPRKEITSENQFELSAKARQAITSISHSLKKNVATEATLASVLGIHNQESLKSKLFQIKVKWPMHIRTLYANPHGSDIETALEGINGLLSLFTYAKSTIIDRDKLSYFTETVLGTIDLRVLILSLINLITNSNYTVLVLSYIIRLFNVDSRCRTMTEIYPLLRDVTQRFVIPLFTKLAAILAMGTALKYNVSGHRHLLLLVKFLYTMVGMGIVTLRESMLLEKSDAYIGTRDRSITVRNLGITQRPGDKMLIRGLQIVHRTYIGPIISGCISDYLAATEAEEWNESGNHTLKSDYDAELSQISRPSIDSQHKAMTYADMLIKMQTQNLARYKLHLPKKPLHYIRRYTLSISIRHNIDRNIYLIIWRQTQNRTLFDRKLFDDLSMHIKACKQKLFVDNTAAEFSVNDAVTSSAPSLLQGLPSSSSPSPPPPPPSSSHCLKDRGHRTQRFSTRLAQAAMAEQYDQSISSLLSTSDKPELREKYMLSSPSSSANRPSSKADDLQLDHLRENSPMTHVSNDSNAPCDPHVTHSHARPVLRGLRNLMTDGNLANVCRVDLADTNTNLLNNLEVASPRTIPHLFIRYNLFLGREKLLHRVPFRDLMNYDIDTGAKYQPRTALKIGTPSAADSEEQGFGKSLLKSRFKTPQTAQELAKINQIIARHIVSISLSEVQRSISQYSISANPVHTPNDSVAHNFKINLSRSLYYSELDQVQQNQPDKNQSLANSLVSSITSKLSELHEELNTTESNIEFIQVATPVTTRASSIRKGAGAPTASRLRKKISQRSQQKMPSLAEMDAPPRDSPEYFPMHIEQLPASGVTQIAFETWYNSDPVFYMVLSCDVDNGIFQAEATGTSKNSDQALIRIKDTIDLTETAVLRWDSTHPEPLTVFQAPRAVCRNCHRKIKPSITQPESRKDAEQQNSLAQDSSVESKPDTDFDLFERELIQYLNYMDHKSGDDINFMLRQKKYDEETVATSSIIDSMRATNGQVRRPFNLKEHLVKSRARRYNAEMVQKAPEKTEIDAIVGGCSLTRRHLIRSASGTMTPISSNKDVLVFYANRKHYQRAKHTTLFADTSEQEDGGAYNEEITSNLDQQEDSDSYVLEEREYSLEENEDGEVRRHYKRYDAETGELLSYISESDHGDEGVGQYYVGRNGKAYVAIRVRYRKNKAARYLDTYKSTRSHSNSPNDINTHSLGSYQSCRPREEVSEGSPRLATEFRKSIYLISQEMFEEIIAQTLRNYSTPKRLTELAENIATTLLSIATTEEQINAAPCTSLSNDPTETLIYFGVSPAEARRVSRGLINDVLSESSAREGLV